ncbi:MAG: hypothetical protein KKD18_06740, partial [Nanoarchaeota archaeon]|nr:hypothetical protein [Nanoarchaeota archaeon]
DLHSIYFPAVVPYNISTANNNKNWYLKINAFHGRDNYDRTNWNISICRDNSSECFEGTKNWTTIYSGDHAVFEYETPIKLMDLASDPSSDESFFVRLRVWNTGEEENSITSYSYFRYIP